MSCTRYCSERFRGKDDKRHTTCGSPYDILNAVVQYHITGIIPLPFGIYVTNPLLWQHWFRYWDFPLPPSPPKQTREQGKKFLKYFTNGSGYVTDDIDKIEERIGCKWNLLLCDEELVVPLLKCDNGKIQCMTSSKNIQNINHIQLFFYSKHKELFDQYVLTIKNRNVELEKLFITLHS